MELQDCLAELSLGCQASEQTLKSRALSNWQFPCYQGLKLDKQQCVCSEGSEQVGDSILALVLFSLFFFFWLSFCYYQAFSPTAAITAIEEHQPWRGGAV